MHLKTLNIGTIASTKRISLSNTEKSTLQKTLWGFYFALDHRT